MAKLFPPTIDGKLPAIKCLGENTFRLNIPFLHNDAIGSGLYTDIAIEIKAAATNLWIESLTINKEDIENSTIKMDISSSKFKVGQYYKIQLAYLDSGEAGMYSTVGVAKCVQDGTAIVSINNILGLEVSGQYEADIADKTEVEYSYNFELYKLNQSSYELIDSSEELIHNSQDNNQGQDVYSFGKILDSGRYKINYNVTTINQSYITDSTLFVTEKSINDTSLPIPQAILINKDCGNVNISVQPQTPSEKWSWSTLYLMRYNEIKWEMLNSISDYFNYIDNTVEQGLIYNYKLCRVAVDWNENEGLYTYKLYEGQMSEIEVDYEPIQLSDKNKQLSIAFNPKINSFKNTIQEQKLDTLGGQYPFIFRNGRMNYKEIGISGLISYHMDNDNLFMQDEELGLTPDNIMWRPEDGFKFRTTSHQGYNIAAERKFRNKVIEWLTNGKPKLLRSPNEGVFIVRLMNVSLTPNEQLGRLLYNFQATAYEIAENNLNNLNKYELIWGER